jgi:hypothetical protein
LIYLILLGVCLLSIGIGLVAPLGTPLSSALSGGGAVGAFFAFSFKYLRVRDEGDCLAIRFGPLPVCRRRIPYLQITGVEAGRFSFWYGWGYRWPSQWVVYYLWGFDCVVVNLGPKTVRIGTDDVDGLLGFLRMRIGERSGRQNAAGSAGQAGPPG